MQGLVLPFQCVWIVLFVLAPCKELTRAERVLVCLHDLHYPDDQSITTLRCMWQSHDMTSITTLFL